MAPSIVATVGLHIVDVLGYPVTGIPEGQGIAFLDRIHMTPAGTCAATAMGLAKLGVPTATFGVVGDDHLGAWLRRELHGYGLNVDGLAVSTLAPTSATMLPIRPNGERPALHVRGANTLITEHTLDWDVVMRCQHLHIGGTSLLPGIDGEPTARILEKAREYGLTTSVDIIHDPAQDYETLLGPCYEHLDYFLPNDEDALSISGTATVTDAASYFRSRGVRQVAITLGADGALIAGPGIDATRVPARAVEVVDTSGCGDAFSAGLILGIVERKSFADAAAIGTACGSLVATGLGSDAGITDRAGLLAFMSGDAGTDESAQAPG